MQSWLEISSSAIEHNYLFFKKLSHPATLVPIIKSNAYGHGLQEVYQILAKHSPTWIGVNYLSAASQLRDLGFKGRILIVGPTQACEYEKAFSLSAEVFLSDFESLDHWINCTLKPRIHIKVDTGMSRQGFLPKSLPLVISKLASQGNSIAGLASHFSNVEDVLDLSYANLQLERFESSIEAAATLGNDYVKHIASSASTLLLPQSRMDLTRVGISLYGLWPSPVTRMSYFKQNQTTATLIPALCWKTKSSIVKTVKSGEYVGYGCTYRAVTDIRVAVIPVGYFEGYPRITSGRGSYVLMEGKRCPIIGRICMNMMMIDVSAINDPKVGDIVTLIGSDGDEVIEASTIANWSDTIHYEVLTSLHPDIPRKVVD